MIRVINPCNRQKVENQYNCFSVSVQSIQIWATSDYTMNYIKIHDETVILYKLQWTKFSGNSACPRRRARYHSAISVSFLIRFPAYFRFPIVLEMELSRHDDFSCPPSNNKMVLNPETPDDRVQKVWFCLVMWWLAQCAWHGIASRNLFLAEAEPDACVISGVRLAPFEAWFVTCDIRNVSQKSMHCATGQSSSKVRVIVDAWPLIFLYNVQDSFWMSLSSVFLVCLLHIVHMYIFESHKEVLHQSFWIKKKLESIQPRPF